MNNNISKNLIKTGIIGLVFVSALAFSNITNAQDSTTIIPIKGGNSGTYSSSNNSNNSNNSSSNNNSTPTIQVPTAFTNPESNVKDNEATFNGYLTTGGSSTVRFFEYGTNANNLNQTTTIKSQGLASGNVSEIVYGLDAGTVYYFRLVAQNNIGTGRGLTLSFKTSGIAPVKKAVATTVAKKATTVAKNTTDKTSSNKNILTAQAASAGTNFLPNTLNGWLLLFILIFALIYIGRKIYKDVGKKDEKQIHDFAGAH